MKQFWEKISLKVDAMSRRERVLVFATLVVLMGSLLNTLLLEPMFVWQKSLQSQLQENQDKITAVQTQIAAMQQANSPNANAPQRILLNRIRQDLAEGNVYLQSSRDKLVLPERMADHLRQLLNRNMRLHLVGLQTLPVAPLIEQVNDKGAEQGKIALAVLPAGMQVKQMYKHGVQLTLRGNYLDLMQYVKAIENLPQQMYWSKAQMNVVQYPMAELTLVLYTLSPDRTWLQI